MSITIMPMPGALPMAQSLSGVDSDCTACHAGFTAVLSGVALLPAASPAFEGNPWRTVVLPSPPDTLPERPDWIASA